MHPSFKEIGVFDLEEMIHCNQDAIITVKIMTTELGLHLKEEVEIQKNHKIS